MLATTHEAHSNVQSLMAIPATRISDSDRARLIKRASAGQDVYAYSNSAEPLIWNVWDTDTRIILPLIANAWIITGMAPYGTPVWRVRLERPSNNVELEIDLFIHSTARDEMIGGNYSERAHRAVLSAVNHCSAFDCDPIRLHHCHF